MSSRICSLDPTEGTVLNLLRKSRDSQEDQLLGLARARVDDDGREERERAGTNASTPWATISRSVSS